MKDLTGVTLGKYQVIERLGRGGMADVYRAYQSGLNRFVAIKVMHPHLADNPDFVERFRREAQSVGNLRHPNIVNVIDFDVLNDEYYMVMEYIQGGSLKNVLRDRGALPLDETLSIMVKLADAVEYAHQQGMIHRDIKPANIMFTTPDNPVLTDFGIAKLVDVSGLTHTGASVGTPAYMSPEASRSEKVDARSDIYSLGIVFYEMLTGNPPFDADTPYAIIYKQINDPLPSPKHFADVPGDVESILYKALAKNPADRYQTSAELRDALLNAYRRPKQDQPKEIKTPPPIPVKPGKGKVDDSTVVEAEQPTHVGVSPRKSGTILIAVVAVIAILAIGVLLLSNRPAATPITSPTTVVAQNPTPTLAPVTPTVAQAQPTATQPSAQATPTTAEVQATPASAGTTSATATPCDTPTPLAALTPTISPRSQLDALVYSEKYAKLGADVKALLAADKPFDALTAVTEALKTDPAAKDLTDARDLLNQKLSEDVNDLIQRDLPRALELVQKVAALYPDSYDWRTLHAYVLTRFRSENNADEVKNAAQGVELANSAISLDGNRPEAYGVLCLHYGNWPYYDWDKAMTACTAAIQRGTRNPWIYRARGSLYHGNRQTFAKALADYDSAVMLAPTEDVFYGDRASVKFDMRDYLGAIADLEEAQRVEDARWRDWRLALLYLITNQKDKALAMYQKHIVDERNSEASYLGDGAFVAWATGQPDKAAEWSDLALLLAPKTQAALYARALLRWDAKQYEEAIKLFDTIAASEDRDYRRLINPYLNRQVFADKARVLAASGNHAEAVKIYDQAIADEYEWSSLYIEQARSYIQLKDKEKARAALQRALQFNQETKDDQERATIIELLRQVGE